MKIGCCVTFGTFVPEAKKEATPGPEERVARLKEILAHLKSVGYDFAEFTVGMIDESVSEDEYEAIRSTVRDSGIPVVAFNCFIPGRLKITGPDASIDALRSYVTTALARAAGLGGSIVVFGSGAARKVPEGWPTEIAKKQVREFIEMAAEVAETNGVKIAIEHLNSGETNFCNSLASAVELCREIGLPSVGVLADLYHLDKEGEGFAAISDAGDLLVHTHVADTNRLYPGSGNADLSGFVQALRDVGFDGGVSVECVWNDFPAESAEAASVLRRLL